MKYQKQNKRLLCPDRIKTIRQCESVAPWCYSFLCPCDESCGNATKMERNGSNDATHTTKNPSPKWLVLIVHKREAQIGAAVLTYVLAKIEAIEQKNLPEET